MLCHFYTGDHAGDLDGHMGFQRGSGKEATIRSAQRQRAHAASLKRASEVAVPAVSPASALPAASALKAKAKASANAGLKH